MAVVTMRQLLDAGVHFGHQTRRWNPKMKRFIFTERNGIYIIDLQQTLSYIDRAYDFVKDTVAHGGTILFVGTKRQAQEAIAHEATRVNMPYVNQRWLGGMLTNFATVHQRLQRLKDLEAMESSGEFAGRTKKEVLLLTREKDKLAKTLGGIRNMAKVPSAIWVVDTKKEHIAVGEARKLGIPVVAVLDTNCDPDEVDYPLPGNDDAIRAASLLTKVIAEAVAAGLLTRSGADAVAAGEEPLAEWEREMLAAHEEEQAAAAAAETAGAAEPATEKPAADPASEAAGAAEKAGPSEPASAEPPSEAPATAEPASAEPTSEQPAAAEPAAAEPATAEPPSEESVSEAPATAEPTSDTAAEPATEPAAEAAESGAAAR